MGKSFVTYGDYGFWSRDGFLEDWLRLVAEIDALRSPQEWLAQSRHHWHIQATAGFIGCISCGFDELLSEPARRDLVLELASRVRGQDGLTRGEATTADLFLNLLRGDLRTVVTSPLDYMAHD